MKFTRIYIDGYGVFHDFDLPGIARGATVLLGKNESGKTTILSFIRTVLFGFQDGRSSDNAYEPLAGGRHGGRITLVDDQGEEFVIERYAGPKGGQVAVTLPDGSAGTADDLSKLLGHTSRDLYRNVFAFSLSELQEFDSLNSEDVRDKIYGAGIGSGRLGLSEIEATLKKERDELYVERGSKQEIAKLLREAADLDGELRECGRHMEEHDGLSRSLGELDVLIAAKTSERKAAHATRDHAANLRRAWDDWTELRAMGDELNGLPEVKAFPPQGISRLERSLQQREDLTEAIKDLRGQIATHEQERAQVQVDESILGKKSEIEGLHRGLDRYESARDDLPKRRSELQSASDDLEEGVRNLGTGWDDAAVKTFDTSLPVHEAVRQHGQDLQVSAQRLHDAERDEGSAREQRERASTERARLEEAWLALDEPPERDRENLLRRRQALRELRSRTVENARRRAEGERLEDRRTALEAQSSLIQRQRSRDVLSLPAWPAFLVPLVTLAVAVVLVVLAEWVGAVAMAAVGVGIGALYMGLRTRLGATSHSGELEDELKSVRQGLEEASREAANAASRIDAAKDAMQSLTKELGLGRYPDERDLDGLEDALEEALSSLEAWEAAEKLVHEAGVVLEGQEERLLAAAEVKNRVQNRERGANEAWREWLEKRAIDTTISPETCLKLLSMVDSLREKTKAIDGLRERIGAMEAALETHEEETNAVRRACNLGEKAGNAFPGAVDELVEALEVATESFERNRQLRRTLEDETGKLASANERMESTDRDIAGLCSEAGAANEEDFRKRAAIFVQREKLAADIIARTRNLEGISGRDGLSAFMAELSDANPEELEQRQWSIDEQLDGLDRELKEATQERGAVDDQIRRLESEEESSGLRLERSVIKEQANSHARRWSVLAIAEALLTETRLKYERERQPAVIQEAQRFFADITDGGYQRILSLPGEQAIAVEDGSGSRKETTQLSRGTAEQLYLSLRFGFIREFAARVIPLPVIMDDILVNFDPERAAAACKALLELSADQQVLLFTCHPATVALMRSASPDCSVVELPQ